MGIRLLFHKLKIAYLRKRETTTIPSVSEEKKYGNDGEGRFINMLYRELPSCKIKRNVLISTEEGNAEIDCLVLYQNKLFAIELKCWKGRLIERENDFLKITTDPWTGDERYEYHKSPFKQLGRAIYLLKRQIPVKAWVNSVVFFDDEGLEEVTTFADKIWFISNQDLVNYICNDGKSSFGTSANEFFEKCISADCLYSINGDKSLSCIINRISLRFDVLQGEIPTDDVSFIRIIHHRFYDELYVRLIDGSNRRIIAENAKIQVSYNGSAYSYALCNLDYIELGNN